MLKLSAMFLEARELPASDPYPPSCLVSVLAGIETLHLIAKHELLSQLEELERNDEVELELRFRRIALGSLGGTGKGNAYRLSVSRILDPPGQEG